MTSLPFSNSDARPFNSSLALSASTVPVPPHPGPRFGGFQFRTIGQQPELLKRISAPNPDMQYEHDSDLLSPSFLSPHQSIQTLAPPESDSAKRPSLQDRISLQEESQPTTRDENVDVTLANPPELRPVFDLRSTQNVPPMATSTTQSHKRYADSSSQRLRTPFSQNCGLRTESDLQDMTYKEKAIKKAGATSASNESRFPIITGSETENRITPPPFVQSSTQASAISAPFSSGEAVHSLAALRTLQSRLTSSLSNFNQISIANALAAAQSVKDQSTEILATAHRAHTLAQQASLSAQDSMVAAQECLTVAVAVQDRADLALSAVEKIRSSREIGSRGEWEYNATVKGLKDDLHQLAEWVSHWDAYESKHLRQLEERENEIRKKNLALQLEHDLNKFSAKKQSYDFITHSESSDLKISFHVGAMTVEDEADAATRAWNQHREQSAERKRLAEDELRQREAEAELERQRLQAQSEADAHEAELEKLQAEKYKAEEEEKSRQEKEVLELQRRQQEIEIIRFLQSQKQGQDDPAKVAVEEKKARQAAEAEKEARLIAEHEQKCKDIHEKELLKRHHDSEKRREMAEIEAKQEVILEQMKRLSKEAQPPVSADTVANIQSMATLTTPPSQHTSSPSSPPSGPNHAELDNVVSKQTFPTNSPQTMQQNRSLPGTIGLDESSNSTNPTSSISSIPKSSTVMQNGAKSHKVPPDIPSSIDKLLPDSSIARIPSNYNREVDGKSGSVCNNVPWRLASSLSPLTPLISTPDSLLTVLAPPATSSNGFKDIHLEFNIHSCGPDTGNVSVIPPSRVPPVSLEAQHANLRLIMDANGSTYGPGASGVNERKPPSSSADQSSVTTERSRRKPLSSFQMNGDKMFRASSASNPETEKKLKLEPTHDVPVLLMMPTPQPPPIIKVAPTCATLAANPKLPDFKKTKASSTASQETSSGLKELPPFPTQTIPPLEPLVQPPEPAVTQLDGSASANSSIPSNEKEKGRPAEVRRNVPPLTSNGQLPNLQDVLNQAFQGNDSRLLGSPRMGPDAAVTDGWAQPVVDDPMAKKQREQLPRSLDRSSPHIIPPVSRLPPKWPRAVPRVDHYSPPRRYNDYSRDRRRSGSVEHTRGFSPPSIDDDRRSDDMPTTIGRKRYRDDDSDDAPPPRRARYASPPFRQDDFVQSSAYRPPDADRSRVASYGRSTDPEPRKTSLAHRLESEKARNSQGGSSYRPNYNDSSSYAYDPQSRNTKNQRYPAASRPQSIPQGSSYYGDASSQSNQQRQSTNDTSLPLLSRFTDSTEQNLPPFDHHGPTRPRTYRGPRDVPPLEQRIEKPKTVPLINRLEDVN